MIDHFSTFPYGGAGQAARKLHEWMVRSGVQSRFNYWEKSEIHPQSESFQPLQFQERRGNPLSTFVRRQRDKHRRRFVCRLYDRHVADRPGLHELYSIPWTLHTSTFDYAALGTDVIHLHWIPFFLDYSGFFSSVPRGVPVVWTLYDMNPLTGGCHYSDHCDRFTQGCGHCRQVDRPGTRDVSWHAFRNKAAAMEGHSLHIVSPSAWLLDLARKSPVFPKSTQFHLIPQGIDERIFRPIPPKAARAELGLPPDVPLVAFGADQITNHRKGLHHLFAALKQVRETVPDVECIVFGGGDLNVLSKRLPPIHSFGYIRDPLRQALLYSAADLFVLPSIEDNQPQTGIEALACETPVVSFETGGIPEFVIHNETGLCAPVSNEQELSRNICELLADAPRRQKMAKNGRRLVEEFHTADRQVANYLGLYENLLGKPVLHRPAGTPERLRRAA